MAKAKFAGRALVPILALQTTEVEGCSRQLAYAELLFISCITPSTDTGKVSSIAQPNNVIFLQLDMPISSIKCAVWILTPFEY